ncbi:hypothetical protein [Streptomyces sp. TLI_171]|uniref:hypothetical protein n=1 Tax=Streptomyces sp. TLI_171 TaxID=1938859 RepID=UPI000C554808|nr:hypothetical protein [Streptomyces sp. TLI_171]RKE19412.1 hypothetical protein BX266_2734 [Streptomyces sp. TLI_171]
MPPTALDAPQHPAPTAAPPPAARPPVLRRWRAARPALAVYAGALALHLLLLRVMARPGTSLADRLTAWDGRHFVEIAAAGYPDAFSHGRDGALTGNDLAFFPLYPLLVRAVHAATGLGLPAAALLTAQLAAFTALLLVHQLITRLHDRRTATAVVVLLAAAQPMSVVFFMAYSESLLLALAAGALLAAHRRAWAAAGLCAFLAGLTRPAGVAVVAALAVAALGELRRQRRWSAAPPVAVALACTGTPLYLGWVAVRLGTPDAWFAIQRAGWGTRWDWGRSLGEFLATTLRTGEGWVPVSIAVLLLAHLLALALARTCWPPLLVYGALVVVLTLGQSNYFHSKPRLLAPAVVVLLPVARALSRAGRTTRVLVLSAAGLFGCWYGAYLLTTWPYAI